jgi:hypothetical protein
MKPKDKSLIIIKLYENMSDEYRTKEVRGQTLGNEERNQRSKNLVIFTFIICISFQYNKK